MNAAHRTRRLAAEFIAAQVIGGALGALIAILLFSRGVGDAPAAGDASG